jgi:AGCS family alanine or glycine:cation symporter
MITFSEIAVNRISRSTLAINFVRCLGLFVAAFGIVVNIAGYDLGNLWAFSDLANIIIVYINIPLLYVGAKYVFRATKQYKASDGSAFTSDVVGIECPYWDDKTKQ